MAQKIIGAQRDFSFGQVDVEFKRSDDHPARKAGLRQMANMRILNSGSVQNRPGRSALFLATSSSRIEEITMSPGNTFKLAIGNAFLGIVNSAGVTVASFNNQGNGAALPWSAATAEQVVYAQLRLSIYITFSGMRPQVLAWDGVSTWTLTDYAELVVGGQKRTWFYRISPQNIGMLPGAQTGAGINLTFTQPILTPAHVGTRMRFVGRQMLITGYTDPLNATVTILESLPGSQGIGFASAAAAAFSLGDVVRGSVTGSIGQVTSIVGMQIIVQLLNTSTTTLTSLFGATSIVAFTASDIVVGPGGGLQATSVSAITSPATVTIWDEEVMNPLQGYPASCFVDQFRLGFCDFPSVPNGIGWSAINSPTDQYVVGASAPSGAMFEVAPDKVRIYYVLPGAESSEFVFCDKKLYYIKIDASNPLRPGSVGFQTLSGDGCAQVQPRITQEVILYANAGRSSIMAIIAPGSYYRPFNTKNLCEFHSHLFSDIRAIAVPTADGSFNERYAYILNGDGSMIVGKYSLQDGQIVPTIGWGPWSGVGAIRWVAASAANVLFTTSYFGTTICEILDDDVYLDSAIPVNSAPAAFAPPGGKGPLWMYPSQTVCLMDQVTRSMGIYDVDANGFIVPQNNGGENLLAASLIAGQPWTSTVEPFCPNANPGVDAGQRMKMRQVTQFLAYVIHSTGFMLGYLFSSKQTPVSPPLGTLMNFRRFPAYNQGDDATLPPPDRETAESYPPQGSSFDPRVVMIKDTPGPLQLLEITIEVSI